MGFSLTKLGVRLVLYAGLGVPLPVSKSVIDAVEQVEVFTSRDYGSGFRITLRMTRTPFCELSLLKDPQLLPRARVVIGLLVGVVPQVLIDGIIETHEVQPGSESGEILLTITGRDLSVVMDQIAQSLVFPACDATKIAAAVLAPYATYGIAPMITAVPAQPNPETFPAKTETDLACLRRLARACNAVFYIEPTAFCVSTAYLGAKSRVALPQSALRIDRGPLTNVQSVSISHTPNEQVAVGGVVFVPGTAVAVTVPPLPSVGTVPLAVARDVPTRARNLPEVAKMSASQALLALQAAADAGAETVHVRGTLDILKYGKVLRCNRPVGVVGAGLSFDGFYNVTSVSHDITRTSYTQSFTLAREGKVSTSPMVVP
ncbi:MAG: hypothetical protein U1A78_38280 [Polyangia bacterium]